jgi:hypothetical protein
MTSRRDVVGGGWLWGFRTVGVYPRYFVLGEILRRADQLVQLVTSRSTLGLVMAVISARRLMTTCPMLQPLQHKWQPTKGKLYSDLTPEHFVNRGGA